MAKKLDLIPLDKYVQVDLHQSITEYRAGKCFLKACSAIETVKEPTLVLAHGAGADSQSDWMVDIACQLSARQIRVITFDFPYMSKCQQDGRKRPPDRQPILLSAFIDIIRLVPTPCWIGGKSMGGRMASILTSMIEHRPEELAELSKTFMVDLHQQVSGCSCFGYPFYAMGKVDRPRIDHLQHINRPVLIFQGTRDPMGRSEQVSSYTLSSNVQISWLAEGDHDFKPTKSSGLLQNDHINTVAQQFSQHCHRC